MGVKGFFRFGLILSALTGVFFLTSNATGADMTESDKNWDKVFAESDMVDVSKVRFKNRYGIELTGDLYLPKGKASEKLAAIAVSGPFGAVKELPAYMRKPWPSGVLPRWRLIRLTRGRAAESRVWWLLRISIPKISVPRWTF